MVSALADYTVLRAWLVHTFAHQGVAAWSFWAIGVQYASTTRPTTLTLECLLQVKAFINEAHYYADATIMFLVWPPEGKAAYTCHNSTDTTADTPVGLSNRTGPDVGDDTSKMAVHCPAGVSKHPEEAVTGWGIWIAERLWREIQWQHKEAGIASALASLEPV